MIHIIGVGDIMPGGMLHCNNSGFASEEIIQKFKGADVRVATLETALGNEPNWYDGKMTRLADVIYTKDCDIEKLKVLDINIVSLANNHVFDLGPDGIKHTISVLDKAGIKHCGAGMNLSEASKPVVLTIKGKTIAFIAFCDWRPETTGWCLMATEKSAGVNPLYEESIERQIKEAKHHYDYVVVIPHWGKEHTYWPTNDVFRLSKKMRIWGADIILGGHTHRIQPVVCKKDNCVAYSLGNFLFVDRVIVSPRSTWYPDNPSEFNYKGIPSTNGYPYVKEPTLKCSPPKNRVGQIVSISIDSEISAETVLTVMDSDCHIHLYKKKNPTKYIGILLESKLYLLINKTRLEIIRWNSIIKIVMSELFHFRFGKIMRALKKRF